MAVNERWIAVASSGNSALTVFDPLDFRLMRTIPLFSPLAVVFGSERDVVLVGDVYPGDGFAAYRLPAGIKLFQAEVAASQIVMNSGHTTFFMKGRYFGVYRTSPAGRVEASFGSDLYGFSAMALSRDDSSLLAVPAGRDTAFLLDASDLSLKRRLELSLRAEVVAPLESHDRWLVVGRPSGKILRGPLLVRVLDTSSGDVREIASYEEENAALLFGTANPWVEIPRGAILVASSFGVIEFHPESERARLLGRTELGGGAPCCDITFDRFRGRLFLTDVLTPEATTGRVRVYEALAQ